MVNHHHRDSALVVLYSVRSFCVFNSSPVCINIKKGGIADSNKKNLDRHTGSRTAFSTREELTVK